MAYANYPQNIFDQFKADILATYPQINIVNKRIIDEDGVVDSDSIGKYGKVLGLWLLTDAFNPEDEGGPQWDGRIYEFEAQLVVKDADEDQNLIWDMAERIKFICESNKRDSSGVNQGYWYHQAVSNIEYDLPDENEPNLKKATLTLTFRQAYGT